MTVYRQTLTLSKCMCMRASGASELRKFWHFYILKLLFLSIFCQYIENKPYMVEFYLEGQAPPSPPPPPTSTPVYMSSLASLKSHGSSYGKMGKKINTTHAPLGTKEGAFCTYLANKTNRAYARLEVYARLPGVKPQNVPDWSLLREHTHRI